jgi:hypothetical protein
VSLRGLDGQEKATHEIHLKFLITRFHHSGGDDSTAETQKFVRHNEANDFLWAKSSKKIRIKRLNHTLAQHGLTDFALLITHSPVICSLNQKNHCLIRFH